MEDCWQKKLFITLLFDKSLPFILYFEEDGYDKKSSEDLESTESPDDEKGSFQPHEPSLGANMSCSHYRTKVGLLCKAYVVTHM